MSFTPLPDDLPGMRAALTEKLRQGSDKMHEHDVAIAEIQEANRKQDEKLERIDRNTSVLVDIFKAGRGTIKTVGWFGKLLIWIGGLSSALYALWYAILNWPQKGG